MQIMMGRSHQCHLPSFTEIGPPVLEKIFEGFLPYIGVAAILVMRPGPFIQAVVPHSKKARHKIKL